MSQDHMLQQAHRVTNHHAPQGSKRYAFKNNEESKEKGV